MKSLNKYISDSLEEEKVLYDVNISDYWDIKDPSGYSHYYLKI